MGAFLTAVLLAAAFGFFAAFNCARTQTKVSHTEASAVRVSPGQWLAGEFAAAHTATSQQGQRQLAADDTRMAFQRRTNPCCNPCGAALAPSSPPWAWLGPWSAFTRGTLGVRAFVPPECPSGRFERGAGPREQAARAHLLRLWLDCLWLRSGLRFGDLRAQGHPRSKPGEWDGMSPSRGPADPSHAPRNEAESAHLGRRHLLLASRLLCGARQSPVSARHAMKLAQDQTSGCAQRAGAPWPSASWT